MEQPQRAEPLRQRLLNRRPGLSPSSAIRLLVQCRLHFDLAIRERVLDSGADCRATRCASACKEEISKNMSTFCWLSQTPQLCIGTRINTSGMCPLLRGTTGAAHSRDTRLATTFRGQ